MTVAPGRDLGDGCRGVEKDEEECKGGRSGLAKSGRAGLAAEPET